MSSYEVSDMPVIDGDQLVGTVRESKLMASVIADRDTIEREIAAYMERPVPIFESQEPVDAAIKALKDVPMIVVREFGRFTGVLTRHDVLEFL
jgi:cystathionine beta-synthase